MVRLRIARKVVGCTAILLACSSDDGIAGRNADAVSDAADLRDLTTEAGIECASPAPFDPTANIAPDGFDYEKPSGLICTAEGGELYLVAYDSAANRDEALDHGEISLGLCKIRSGDGEASGWYSVVGANWRIASPDARDAIERVDAVVDGAESESFGCLGRD